MLYAYKLFIVSDIFLSAHCLDNDCQKHPDRATFCCRRNFNPRCCYYHHSDPQNSYLPFTQGWNQIGGPYQSHNHHPYGTGTVLKKVPFSEERIE